MGEVNGLVTQTALAIRDEDELEVAASILDTALRRAKAEGMRLGAEMVEDDCYGGMHMFDDNDMKLSQVDQWKRTYNKNQCRLARDIRARAAQIEEGE